MNVSMSLVDEPVSMNGRLEEDTSAVQGIEAQLIARNVRLMSWQPGHQLPLSSSSCAHERQRLRLAQQAEYYVGLDVGLFHWKRPVRNQVDLVISMCLGRSG